MALNVLTLATLKNAVRHAIGGEPAATTSTTEIVNDAIAYMVNSYDWTWRHAALSLNSVGAQNYIALPADFGRIETLYAQGNNYQFLRPTTLDHIMRLRQGQTTFTSTDFFYAVSALRQLTTTSAAIYKLEIYPTPSATVTGFLMGVYQRLIPALSTDADVPDIGANCFLALKWLCRGFAVSTEEQQDGPDWQKANQFLKQAQEEDGGAQKTLGRMRGGLYDRADVGGPFVERTITQ